MNKEIKIGIIGLGYVGLPLLSSFSKKFNTIGFDIDKKKILKLKKLKDESLQLNKIELKKINKKVTTNINDLKSCNIYIVTVPTPVNKFKHPDLSPLKKACNLIS